MYRSFLRRSVLMVLAMVLWTPATAHAQDQAATPVQLGPYEVTDLGTLGGTYSSAYGVNQAGQVVGESTTAPDQEPTGPGTHAFLWSEGNMTDLGTLGGEASSAQDINEAGQVIGSADTAEGTTHAFLWEDGEMIDLGTLDSDFSRATSVNEAGQVVGTSETADGAVHPFLLGGRDNDGSRHAPRLRWWSRGRHE